MNQKKQQQPVILTPKQIETWPYILIEFPDGRRFAAEEKTWAYLKFQSKMQGEDIRISHLIQKYAGEPAIIWPEVGDA